MGEGPKITLQSAQLSNVRGVPLYIQIREALRDAILRGIYRVDDQIPPEDALAAQYGVSRMTARRAVMELVNEGLLVRYPGRGTFVGRPKLGRRSTRLTSYFEEMVARGLQPSSQVLSLGLVPASGKIASALEIPEGQSVIRVERLRFANDEPMTIHEAYIPYQLYPELLRRKDLGIQSLYVLYEQRGFRLAKGRDRIEARLADARQAKLLGISCGSPILYTERITYTDDGTIIEFVQCYSRADRYFYQVDLHR